MVQSCTEKFFLLSLELMEAGTREKLGVGSDLMHLKLQCWISWDYFLLRFGSTHITFSALAACSSDPSRSQQSATHVTSLLNQLDERESWNNSKILLQAEHNELEQFQQINVFIQISTKIMSFDSLEWAWKWKNCISFQLSFQWAAKMCEVAQKKKKKCCYLVRGS